MSDFALLIDGNLVPGKSEIAVVNPATEGIVAMAPAASSDQLDEAVTAARRAFSGWSATPFDSRVELVRTIADAIEGARDELAELLILEQGKPRAAALGEVDSTVEYVRFFTTLTLEPEVVEDSEIRRVEIRRDPLGVVAAIVPWNYPLLLLAFKLPPALLAGNTVVVKPATTTPLTTLRLGRIIADIVPAGVVNIVSGGDDLGPLLTAHPDVQKISFTGSSETGKRVMASASSNLTRITLELGGNDPAIVLADANVDDIAGPIFRSAFGNSGQVCRAIKRVYVHASKYEELCEALAQLAQHATVGDGREPGVEYGPVQNATQFQRLTELLEDAAAEGIVMPGGGLVGGAGYFVRPTVVKNLDDDSRLVVEEQFGPILPVLPFTDIDDAIERANRGPYGLASSIWTRDLDKASEIAHRITAGTVWVNKHVDRTPHLPVAGAKQSGIGVELGDFGLREFTQIKVVNASRATG